MNTTIQLIGIQEKNILENLINEYHREILNEENPRKYKYLDLYWQENDRSPFFIMNQNTVVGFILINKHCLVPGNEYNLAEFYVVPSHRKSGFGKQAALLLFKQFLGCWEVRVLDTNSQVILFWENIINTVSMGKYERISQYDDDWKGIIFSFQSK